ncbi:MAG: leucyl aminopeptidase family protein, partial [Gammaproteobacteria bacterium]|nr:leucyl aminopeptidase family protein [Gammaproteobacteria bacterium]
MNKYAVRELAKLTMNPAPFLVRGEKTTHLLIVLPAGAQWHEAPDYAAVEASLLRRGKKAEELGKQASTLELSGGCVSVWLRLDETKSAFDWHSALRQAMKPLLDEQPASIEIAFFGDADFRRRAASAAAYVAWLNGTPMPVWKRGKPPKALKHLVLHGVSDLDLKRERALAEGNSLCRELTMLPPNVLTPSTYRARIRALADEAGWEIEEYDIKRLTKLKAGAFLAVARGSGHQDAAIVRLSFKGKGAKGGTTALVGKGICFDTGGHNLKPARYMNNMHDDMNGSAVALGILLAATRLKLPVKLDVWLAIAENHL